MLSHKETTQVYLAITSALYELDMGDPAQESEHIQRAYVVLSDACSLLKEVADEEEPAILSFEDEDEWDTNGEEYKE